MHTAQPLELDDCLRALVINEKEFAQHMQPIGLETIRKHNDVFTTAGTFHLTRCCRTCTVRASGERKGRYRPWEAYH